MFTEKGYKEGDQEINPYLTLQTLSKQVLPRLLTSPTSLQSKVTFKVGNYGLKATIKKAALEMALPYPLRSY
jgi:hypothetical protein